MYTIFLKKKHLLLLLGKAWTLKIWDHLADYGFLGSMKFIGPD